MTTRQLNKIRRLEGIDSVEVKDGKVIVTCSDGCPYSSYLVITGIEEKAGETVVIESGGINEEDCS